jgi:hypothetical protein
MSDSLPGQNLRPAKTCDWPKPVSCQNLCPAKTYVRPKPVSGTVACLQCTQLTHKQGVQDNLVLVLLFVNTQHVVDLE